MLSRYRGLYCDIIFVPSGVPSRDQQNDPDDDDDDLNGDRDSSREICADEMRMHRAGQVRSLR